jgi:hypothetical protein
MRHRYGNLVLATMGDHPVYVNVDLISSVEGSSVLMVDQRSIPLLDVEDFLGHVAELHRARLGAEFQ